MLCIFVSVWKPLNVVHDYDLLYCGFSTVQPTDLVAVDRVSSEYAVKSTC